MRAWWNFGKRKGGRPGLYGRGERSSLLYCALALVVVRENFRGVWRMRKGNPQGMAPNWRLQAFSPQDDVRGFRVEQAFRPAVKLLNSSGFSR